MKKHTKNIKYYFLYKYKYKNNKPSIFVLCVKIEKKTSSLKKDV